MDGSTDFAARFTESAVGPMALTRSDWVKRRTYSIVCLFFVDGVVVVVVLIFASAAAAPGDDAAAVGP